MKRRRMGIDFRSGFLFKMGFRKIKKPPTFVNGFTFYNDYPDS